MDKKFTGLLVVFFLSFSVFFTMVVFNKPLSRLIRASQEITPSAEKSLIIAYPLTAKANGKDKILITVFLRNNNGLPVDNKEVIIDASLGKIQDNNLKTNKQGQATFILTSETPGLSQISAKTSSVVLTKKLSIEFK